MRKQFAVMLFVLVSVVVAAAQTVQQTAAQQNPALKEVLIFGQPIKYLEAGTGPTVILLHGLGGSTQNWMYNIGPLSQQYRVIVLDQIGFGRSARPAINYRVRTYVDFLEQFYQTLNIERATLVGNSMGGWIAAIFATSFPEKVDRLVLADATGYAPPPGFDYKSLYGLNPSTREGMKLMVGKVFFNKAFTTDAMINQFMAQRMTAGDGYTINSLIESVIRGEDFLESKQLQQIKAPTLIVWGREDGLTLLAEGERLKKDIPNSKLVVFDQCGHFPQIEKAAEFNAAVLEFLSHK
jgi:pimeloyl-ACP methyl ester carboxylesterase